MNYRYTDNELLYLLDNSDAEVLVLPHAASATGSSGCSARPTKLKAVIEVDDGGPHVDGRVALGRRARVARAAPTRIEGQPDDIYMLYTGGTTGMPKGVMYTHGVFPIALAGFGAAITGLARRRRTSRSCSRSATSSTTPPVWLAACPQMHGTGMWLGTMAPLLMKGTRRHAHQPVVRRRTSCGRRSSARASTAVVIVGDAFAKPMLRALDEKAATTRRR